MAITNITKQAQQLLDRLVDLDFQTVEAYYDMGSIISSMQHGQLYKALDYNSIAELVENELTYTASTAYSYANMYRQFRRLHYLKHEAVNLLKKFGLTHMRNVLPKINDKIGERAIKKRIKNLDQHQINFTLYGSELDLCHEALEKMGAQRSDAGRYANSSEAFMGMVEAVNRLVKTERHLKVAK